MGDPESMSAHVAITGVGIVSAIGCGHAPFWGALTGGRSGVAHSAATESLVAAVPDFDGHRWITGPLLRRMDRLSQMLVAATTMAIGDAELAPGRDAPPERIGIFTGTALGNLSETVSFLSRLADAGPSRVSPSLFPNLVMNASASYAGMTLPATGPTLTISEGDISGEVAVSLGHDMLRRGIVDVAIVGGVDELSPARCAAYHDLGLLPPGGPAAAWAGPFGRGGTTVAPGEGAAMLVLERTDQARARGRRAYAEIIGAHYWAVESPPHGWPSDSTGIAAEIAAALRLFPDAADAIFSGATGRQQRDALELSAYARACSGTRPPWVTSIKGATGDFGAAGALTIAAAALAIAGQIVPPLCRLDVPPEATGVRLAGQEAAPADLHHVLVSGLAHGGQGLAIGLRQPSA